MTATLIGSATLGDAIPGLDDSLNIVGNGLTELTSAAQSVTGAIGDLQNEINGLADSVDSAVQEIIAGPFAVASQSLDAAKSGLDVLKLENPLTYLAGVIAGIEDALALLASLDPTSYYNSQIAGIQGAIDNLQSELDSFQNQLNDLTSIADDVRKQTAALGELRRFLDGAVDDALGPITEFNEALSTLLNSGVFVVHYEGALQSLGSEVDSALGGTGIGSDESVATPLLVVRTANTATRAALGGVFGIV